MLFVGQEDQRRLKIKKLREEKKLSQAELSNSLHMSQQSLSSLERGETRISVDKLLELSQALDTSPEELIQPEANNVFKHCTLSQSAVSVNTFHNHCPLEITKVYEEQLALLRTTIAYQKQLLEQLGQGSKS